MQERSGGWEASGTLRPFSPGSCLGVGSLGLARLWDSLAAPVPPPPRAVLLGPVPRHSRADVLGGLLGGGHTAQALRWDSGVPRTRV